MLDALLQEPQLRPFLPLLYVAWADGDLSTEERELLRSRLAAQPWLKPRLREQLEQWLDPASPPSAGALARVHLELRRAAATLSPEARRSVGELARAMADAGSAVGPQTLAAVDELARIVGPEVTTLHLAQPAAAPEDEARFRGPPAFDVALLQRHLDGRFAQVRDRVRALLAEPEWRAAYGFPKEEHRARALERLKALADAGFGELAYPGVTSPREVGDLGPFFATFETLGFGDLSVLVKFGVQFGLWGGSIYSLGTEEQRRALLPKIASAQALGCFAMSEVGHGSNVADLETTATWDPQTRELVIHTPSESARKDWAGNAARDARWATVFAQLWVGESLHGVHAVVVPIRDGGGEPMPGVRIGDCGHKMGLNGVDNGRIWFDHVRVPKENLLGRYARITDAGEYESPIESPSRRFFTMLGTLVGGRVSVASAAVSAAKVGLAISIRYATARRQFGPVSEPETLLLDYPTHQRRLLPALAGTYAWHFAVDALREQFLATPREGDTRELEAAAAGIKAGASWHCTEVLQQCREACGGQGYLSVNRIGDLKADSDIFTTFEGDNTVLMQLLARGLLTNFRQQFQRGGPSALVRYVADRAISAVLEKNPLTVRGTDEETLRSSAFQLGALRAREERLLSTAARRIKRRIDGGMPPELASREVQEHLVALSQAHVERRVMEAFVEGVERAPEALKAPLERLRALHGLCTLERRMAWFLEHGYFEGVKARAIRKGVQSLFSELLPDAVPLVDAFGIPDACLAAPIAFSDPAHPRW